MNAGLPYSCMMQISSIGFLTTLSQKILIELAKLSQNGTQLGTDVDLRIEHCMDIVL